MTSLSAFSADIDLFLKGSVTVSKFNLTGSENRMGAAAGFGSKFHITDSHFFISAQAMYAQKGQDNQVEANGYYVSPVLMHMIEVPVMFGGQFDLPVKDMKIAIAAGPYIAYDYRFHEYTENMKYIRKETKMKGISHGDVGVSMGLEVHFKRLFVFYDYDLGLRDMNKHSNILGQDLCHRSMRIGAGYTFPTLKLDKQRKKPQM